MAVIALTSASGSPGVTTTALGLALLWPRPVLLIEADPSGSSALLSGFFRGLRPYERGLFELLMSPVEVSEALAEMAQPITGSQASFIAGTRSHLQAAALRDLWEPLADAVNGLEASGQDVIIDAGRLGLVGSPEPMLASADVTLVATRANLPALSGVRSWADSLARGVLGWSDPGLLVIGSAPGDYGPRDLSSNLGLPVVATIADDPEAAAVYHRGSEPPRRFTSSPLIRSLRAAVDELRGRVERRRLVDVEEAR